MSINQSRITALRLGIRDGEMRLTIKAQTGKEAIRRAIANSKTRIERLEKGLDEGTMVFVGNQWVYEYEAK